MVLVKFGICSRPQHVDTSHCVSFESSISLTIYVFVVPSAKLMIRLAGRIATCVYVMPILSRIGGRGKGSKCTCCLECIYFTTFDFLHGAYLTAVTEPHACVQRKTLLVLRSQTRHMHSVFWVF